MKIINKCNLFVISILIALSFTSCRSKMGVIKATANKNPMAKLFEQNPRFETFRSQIQINTSGLNAKGDLRIVKNKTIYLSVQAFLGIEVARLKITPDSLIALDRLHRRYFADTFAHIYGFNKQGVNYFTLQALFSNSLFLLGEDSLSVKDMDAFQLTRKSDLIKLTAKKEDGTSFEINKDYQLSQTSLGKDNDRLKLNWSYRDFASFSDLVFPQTMELNAVSPKKSVSATLQYAKIELNKPQQVDLVIPIRYAKVDLSEILKIFSEL